MWPESHHVISRQEVHDRHVKQRSFALSNKTHVQSTSRQTQRHVVRRFECEKRPKFDIMAASQSADTPFQPAARQQVMSPSLRLPGEDRQGPEYGRIHEQRLDGGAPMVNGYGSVPVTSAGMACWIHQCM